MGYQPKRIYHEVMRFKLWDFSLQGLIRGLRGLVRILTCSIWRWEDRLQKKKDFWINIPGKLPEKFSEGRNVNLQGSSNLL